MNGNSNSPAPSNPAAGAPPAAPAAAAPKKARWRNRRVLVIGSILVVIAAVVGGWWLYYSMYHESTDDAFIDGNIVPMSSKVKGYIAKVNVLDNQWVEAGTVLVELDPHDYEADVQAAKAALAAAQARQKAAALSSELTHVTSFAGLDQAKAALAAAQAQVQAARSGLVQAQVMIIVARADAAQAQALVEAKKATADRDQLDLQRAQQVFKQQAISQQDLDHAQAAMTAAQADWQAAVKTAAAAQARVTQAQAGLSAAQAAVAQSQAQVQQAQAAVTAAEPADTEVARSKAQVSVSDADIQEAQAALTRAELNLSYTKIVAPCAGWVTRKSAEKGAYATGGERLLAIVRPDVWVVANFKETQLTYMRPGQPVTVEVDAFPGHTFRGHVQSIQAGTGARFSLLPPENATGNYIKVVQRVPVKIVFDADEHINGGQLLLAPGMSVVPVVNITRDTAPMAQGPRGAAPEALSQR